MGRTRLRPHLLGLAAFAAAYFAVFALGFGWAEDGFFHRFFDQVSYRYEAAKVAEALGESLTSGLDATWNQTTAQGFTYPLVGGVAYWLGIDPAHAMFAIFLVGLLVVWSAFSGLGRQPWPGWLALALFASTTTLLNKTGGPTDFRPDFLGQILWTTATALALSCRGFAHRGTCIALGVLFGGAFCSRSLLAAYAAAALPLCVLVAWLGAPLDRENRRARLRNLALTAAIAGAIATPFFIANFERMWDYYIANHLSEQENAARGYNRTFADNLPDYIRSLRRNHIGWAAAFLMLVSLCLTLRGSWREHARRWPLLLVWLAFLMPLVVMAAGPQFSSTVSGVAAGTAVFLALVPGVDRANLEPPRRLIVAITVLGLAVWPARFLYKCARDHDERVAAGHHLIAAQHQAILAHTAGGSEVLLSTLPLIEAHSLAMLELVGFEASGQLPRRFAYGLGHQIYRCESTGEFERKLRASAVVVWWDGGASGGDLPANREAVEQREVIARVLAGEFVQAEGPAGEIELEGHPLRLYFARESAAVAGARPDEGGGR